jgi:PKD repeat protein
MRNALIVLSCLFIPALALAQVIPANNPPVADAGPAQAVFVGDLVRLDGTGSYDPDGDPIALYMWTMDTIPAGSTANLDNPFGDTPAFTPDLDGVYVISLIVTDGELESLADTVSITAAFNQPPTAEATADPIEGVAPLTVSFDGTGSFDPEGAALYADWTFGDSSLPVQGLLASHTYTAAGTYWATLTVVDEQGLLDTDSVEIVVAPDTNNPPTANPVATPNSGTAPLVVTFAAQAADADNDPLTYLWNFGDPDSADNESTLANPDHVYEAPGTYVAWLTVSDGQEEVSASVAVVVSSGQALSTRKATVVKRALRKAGKGTISYWADIDLPVPAPDDVISLTFDGVKLFTKPFGRFKQGRDPNVYLVVKRRLLVRIDFDTNCIYVLKRRANLKKFDNSDGVDVELLWGDDTAVDQFVMTQVTDNVWSYERDNLQ